MKITAISLTKKEVEDLRGVVKDGCLDDCRVCPLDASVALATLHGDCRSTRQAARKILKLGGIND